MARKPKGKKAKKTGRKAAPKKAGRKVRKPARKKAPKKPAKKIKKAVRKPAPKKPARKNKKAVRKPAPKKPVKKIKKPAPKPVAPKPVAPKPAAPKPAAAPKPPLKAEGAWARFCWHDLMSNDVDAAVRFYRTLFGWSTHTMDMGPMGLYTIFAANGLDFAGVAKLPRADVLPHWMGYVGVPNVDAACARAATAGGSVRLPPTQIPAVGRFAILADPTGGALSAIQLDGPPMRDPAVRAPGLVCWNELITPDPAKAGPFYTSVFGWTLGRMQMPDASVYELFKRGAEDEAGMMRTPPNVPAGPGSWMVYFQVLDADVTSSRAQLLGARTLMPPWTVPTVGRMAVLSDPTGAVFALLAPEKKP